MKSFLISVLILFSFVPHSYAMPIISTFDVDDEGWMTEVDKETIAYESIGGNPGGFLSLTDLYWAETASTFPPSKFKGDLFDFDGGILSYDLIVIEKHPPLTQLGGIGRIQLNGGGSNATFDYTLLPNTPIPSSQSWTTYHVPMTASAWHTTQENWEKVLSDVTYSDIILDIGDQGTFGLDNFKIEPIIPEPATLSLLGLGLFGLMIKKKRSENLDQSLLFPKK